MVLCVTLIWTKISSLATTKSRSVILTFHLIKEYFMVYGCVIYPVSYRQCAFAEGTDENRNVHGSNVLLEWSELSVSGEMHYYAITDFMCLLTICLSWEHSLTLGITMVKYAHRWFLVYKHLILDSSSAWRSRLVQRREKCRCSDNCYVISCYPVFVLIIATMAVLLLNFPGAVTEGCLSTGSICRKPEGFVGLTKTGSWKLCQACHIFISLG